MYFSGNPNSEIVFIEFNPGNGALAPTSNGTELEMRDFNSNNPPIINSYESYINFCKNMAVYKAKLAKMNDEKISNFDSKKLHFFSGFGGFNLPEDNFSFDDMINLRSNIFQLELVPYMSNRFSFSHFPDDYMDECFERTFKLVNSCKRKHIFLTGSQRELKKRFGTIKFEKIQLQGRTKDIYFGIKTIADNEDIILLSTYKDESLVTSQMREYGKIIFESLFK